MRIIVCLLLSSLLVNAGAEPVRSTGLVLPYQQVELAANSDGVIREILVKEGDAITAGQVLAQLESAREALDVDLSKVIMEKRAADLAAAEALFNEKIFSKNQVDDRRLDAKVAETQHQAAKQRLQERSIRAPFAGLVLRLFKQRGASLRSLERFAEVADLSRVVVTLYLDAANLQRIKLGQTAEVTIPLVGTKPFSGVVDVVDPVVDPATGQFRVKVLVDNSARQIWTGTRASVVIQESPADVPAR